MKLALGFANTGPFATGPGARAIGPAAEAAGFESVWTVEHVLYLGSVAMMWKAVSGDILVGAHEVGLARWPGSGPAHARERVHRHGAHLDPQPLYYRREG